MGAASKIEWTDHTFSPWIGKKSAGRLLDGRTHDDFPTPQPTSLGATP